MTFTGIPFFTSVGLFAVATAALAALHVLRSRPRRVRVVTMLFWREAKSAAQPRTLWHRFRYLLTFLLLLAIAGLMVFALSQPVWWLSAAPARYVVLVIDAGMSMQAKAPRGLKPAARTDGDVRFDLARQAAANAVELLGARDRLTVVVADPEPRVIHRFDQPLATAGRHLQRLQPADRPANAAAAIRLANSLLAGHEGSVILWVTDQNLNESRPRGSGPLVTAAEGPRGLKPTARSALSFIPIRVGGAVSNAGILSAMFLPDGRDPTQGRLHVRIGRWGFLSERVPIRAEVVRSGRLLLDEQPLIDPGNSADVVSPLIQANGEQVRVTLTELEGTKADNQLTFRLPNRPRIVIAADSELPAALQLALSAAPARLVPLDDPAGFVQAVIAGSGHAKGGAQGLKPVARPMPDRPAVMLVNEGQEVKEGAVVRVTAGSALVDGLDLEQAVCGAGPAIVPPVEPERAPPIDKRFIQTRFTPLLEAGGAVLAALDESNTNAPRLLLSAALFERSSTVPDHPTFAIFLSRAVRHLAYWDPLPVLLGAARAIADPVWGHQQTQETGVVVAPGDRNTSDLSGEARAASTRPTVDLATAGFLTVSQAMLVFALVLLLIEAWLHARGRIV